MYGLLLKSLHQPPKIYLRIVFSLLSPHLYIFLPVKIVKIFRSFNQNVVMTSCFLEVLLHYFWLKRPAHDHLWALDASDWWGPGRQVWWGFVSHHHKTWPAVTKVMQWVPGVRLASKCLLCNGPLFHSFVTITYIRWHDCYCLLPHPCMCESVTGQNDYLSSHFPSLPYFHQKVESAVTWHEHWSWTRCGILGTFWELSHWTWAPWWSYNMVT